MSPSAICVLLLMLIAAVVSVMQYMNGRKNMSLMWGWIVAYWVVLTIKNFFDLI